MRDPGLQAERTALAWQRTGITAALVGGIAVLAGLHRGSVGLVVAACLVTALTAGLTAVVATVGERGPWARLLVTAATTVLVAALGVVLSLS